MITEGWGNNLVNDVHWLKVRDNQIVFLQFIFENMVHYDAHYVGKRMRICGRLDCEFCRAAIGVQRRYVFDVVHIDSKQQMLFECSKSVAAKIRTHSDYAGGLLNRVFELSRMSSSKFSNMHICEITNMQHVDESRYQTMDIKSVLESQENYFRVEAIESIRTSRYLKPVDIEEDILR